MSDYKKLKQELEALRDKCKELEDKIEHANEPKLERVPKGENYFMVIVDFANGKAIVDNIREAYDDVDNSHYDSNNYFKTRERAQEVADKINFLLKLERYHDTFCPDFVPDWDDFRSYKYTIFYDHNQKIYKQIYSYSADPRGLAYFPSEEIAQKVCEILNKENKKSDYMIEF